MLARSIWNILLTLLLGLPSACSPQPIAVIAHRGVSAEAPENTLPAIQRAIDLGCDYVEVDVQATQDGRIVLMHDLTVDRTTSGQGKVSDLGYADISQLDAGVKFSERFRGTRVPLLEEAIALARGKIKLYLDMKTPDPEPVVQVVKKHQFSFATCYRAYTLHALERIRYLDPKAEIVFDMDAAINLPGAVETITQRLPGVTLGCRLGGWKTETLARARKLGARVFINVLDTECTPENLQRAVNLRPIAIQTDDPATLLKILGRARPKNKAAAGPLSCG